MAVPLDDMQQCEGAAPVPSPAPSGATGSSPRQRSHAVIVLGVAMATGLALLPVFHRLISDPSTRWFGYNDFTGHVAAARDLGFDPLVLPPHVLFHVLVRGLIPLTGPGLAAGIVSVGSIALLVLAIVRMCSVSIGGRPGLSPIASLTVAVGFVVADSPSLLMSALGLSNLGSRVAIVHTWANPTDNIGIPLAILLLTEIVILLDRQREPDTRRLGAGGLVTLTVLSMLAKPTFAVILPAALAVHVLVTRPRVRSSIRRVVLACLVPVVATFLLQVVVLGVLAPPEIGRSGIRFAPFETLRVQHIGEGGILFWTAAFPIAVAAWAGGRRFLRDPFVRFVACGLPLALAGMFLFVETGIRARDGNFSRPAQMWWTLLLISSVRFVALELRDRRIRRTDEGYGVPVWAIVFVALALTAIGGGVVAYHDALGGSPWIR